ncbi:hypothetical protein VTN77DRAFT_3171 [Rasamsonia byssochlamydoides]|uniref:uncharacterized protein n=1 Tax=Rasamsonia byssochlamydoides TaxID=89139 RepID=UPI0037437558
MDLVQTPPRLSDVIWKLFLSDKFFAQLGDQKIQLLTLVASEWIQRGKPEHFETSLKRLLHQASAPLGKNMHGLSPLHFAVVDGNLELIQPCLHKRARFNPTVPMDIHVPVFEFAVRNGAPRSAIEYLLENNAEIIPTPPSPAFAEAEGITITASTSGGAVPLPVYWFIMIGTKYPLSHNAIHAICSDDQICSVLISIPKTYNHLSVFITSHTLNHCMQSHQASPQSIPTDSDAIVVLLGPEPRFLLTECPSICSAECEVLADKSPRRDLLRNSAVQIAQHA